MASDVQMIHEETHDLLQFKLTETINYHEWELRAANDGFPVTQWCSAYGVVMFNDHVVARCPSEITKRSSQNLYLSTHNSQSQLSIDLQEEQIDLGFINNANVHYCNHLSPAVVLWSLQTGILSTYVFGGIILDCKYGHMIGKFEYKSQRKGNYVPARFSQFSLSSDQKCLCAILQYKPRRSVLWSVGKYEALLFSKKTQRSEYSLLRKISQIEHVHREGPISLIPPGFDNEKLFLVNTQLSDNNQNNLSSAQLVCDISYKTGEVRKSLSYSSIAIANDMDWGNWIIQNVECNRTGTVFAICCEVTTMETVHSCRIFIFQSSTLHLLDTIEFTIPLLIIENISNLRIKGCFQNVTPVFSHCGSKLAILNCDQVPPNCQETVKHLGVYIYSLPTAKSLEELCNTAILKLVKSHEDINCLPLPNKLLNKLHYY